MILLIVGLPCSGKTTALDVCKKLGARIVASGDVIRDEIAKRGLPYNEQTDREMAGWFHEGRERLLVERVLEKAQWKSKKDFVAIDGFRSEKQIAILEELTGVKPVVVALEAPVEDRLQRCLKRHRFSDETEEYLTTRDKVELARGLNDVLRRADRVFDTTGMDETTFRKAFETFINKIVK